MTYRSRGSWGTIRIASKASQAYAIGDLLATDGTNVVPASATSPTILGICKEEKSSSLATVTPISVAVPKDKSATFVATVTGTFAKANEGRYFDLSDSKTVNTAATTYKPVRCVRYINDTTGVFAINDPIA